MEQTVNIEQSLEVAEIAAEGAEMLPEQQEERSAESEALPTPEVPVVRKAMGIGEFVRHMLLNSDKSSEEILALVRLLFPESRTTPACIAWYKTDLRKKGLLVGRQTRTTQSIVLSAEELEQLTK